MIKKSPEQEKRKGFSNELKTFESDNSTKYKRILENIYKISKKEPNYYFTNLKNILSNPYFLANCYENIRKNQGSLTKGTDDSTADRINAERISNLSNLIKNDLFKFKPSRRIEIPKPGKTTMRPLTIPNFDDRIVQEGIRLILNSIYEPTFEKNNCNFGFREHLGTNNAIDFILHNRRGTTYVIEGDIEKAYDTVNFNKLLQILNRKIQVFLAKAPSSF